jgi:formylglycine-generating enzyme required for sulfatase activity
MLGNVREWTNDWYGPYEASSQDDPPGPTGRTARVERGGSWNTDPWNVRVSCRSRYVPSFRYDNMGFRYAGEMR